MGRAAGDGADAAAGAEASFIFLFVMKARYSASLSIFVIGIHASGSPSKLLNFVSCQICGPWSCPTDIDRPETSDASRSDSDRVVAAWEDRTLTPGQEIGREVVAQQLRERPHTPAYAVLLVRCASWPPPPDCPDSTVAGAQTQFPKRSLTANQLMTPMDARTKTKAPDRRLVSLALLFCLRE